MATTVPYQHEMVLYFFGTSYPYLSNLITIRALAENESTESIWLVYLSDSGHTKEIELGQVVLIHDESAKRTRWKSGRVVKLIPGNDGKTRRVNVLIADKFRGKGSTMITRDPKSLYPLELHAGQIDDDHRNTGPYEDSELSSTQLDQGPTGGVSEIPTDEAHSHRPGANPLAEEG
ncbi:hypothetical protein OUZ56_010254 [Daphnia magna]|uniref:DUF5641 domain-containing protein n=1 Tax=Daphnia magna TaxID=35525 RepID=A0ABR0AIA1_9CRUS|nr:hypothetical protein OUZ56_010254 [Daphnia magna]